MTGSLHETYKGEDVPPPSERSTGLVFAAVTMIGAILLRNSTPVLPALLAITSLGFLAVGVLAPARLARLNRAWFKLALALNRVVSPVVMLVLFAVTILPFGLAMQLKRDPLRKRRMNGAGSYWIAREQPAVASSMRDQF